MSTGYRCAGIAMCLFSSAVMGASAQVLEFDEAQLRRRGLDPAMARYFREAPRFTPGTHRVTLTLNGRQVGKLLARFDSLGQLCFDATLIRMAGLRPLPSPVEPEDENGCQDFLGAHPSTYVELQPADAAVSLIVSPQALASGNAALGNYTSGGAAAMFNYDVYGSRQVSQWGTSQQVFAGTELGFNAGNWMVRSRQSFSQSNGVQQGQWLHGYAQTSLPEQGALLQLGQINVQNSVLAGLPVTGMQWLPETALERGRRPSAPIEGTAQGPAQVEVRQGQASVYSTLVPPGPFRLEGVQPLNRQQDLEVIVRDSTGQERRSIVPIAAFSANASAPVGLSVTLGQARSYGDYATDTPWLGSVSRGFALGHERTLAVGALAATSGYVSTGASLEQQWSPSTGGTLALAASYQDQRPASTGLSATATVRHQLGERLSLSAGLTQRSAGFTELAQTLARGAGRGSAQRIQSLALGGSHPWFGGYSLSYVQAFSGVSSRVMSLGWNRAFGPLSVSARLEQDIGTAVDERPYAGAVARGDKRFHVSFSLPLGTATRWSAYARDAGRGLQLGSSLSGRLSEPVTYRLQAAEGRGGTQDRGGDVDWQGRTARVGVGVNDSSGGYRTYTGRLSGAAAWHAQGITLGAAPLGDTFAIASVGDVAGARLETPAGSVHTDRHGRALVVHVPPYQESEVRLVARTLPRDADVASAIKSLNPGRGAVPFVTFDVQRTRRVLLSVTTANGQLPPKGSAVLSAEGQWITAVGARGKVYLPDANQAGVLHIQLDEERRCRLAFELPLMADEHAHYDVAEAQCLIEEAA